jgi:hypothetical protein
MFNLTYAELSILLDKLTNYQEMCGSIREKGLVAKNMRQVRSKMNEMVKVSVG